MNTELLILITAVAMREDAQRLAESMVEQGLAACAQITAIDSYFHWRGDSLHEPEWRLEFKTVRRCVEALETALRAAHPYDLPELLAYCPERVSADYLAWVQEQCRLP